MSAGAPTDGPFVFKGASWREERETEPWEHPYVRWERISHQALRYQHHDNTIFKSFYIMELGSDDLIKKKKKTRDFTNGSFKMSLMPLSVPFDLTFDVNSQRRVPKTSWRHFKNAISGENYKNIELCCSQQEAFWDQMKRRSLQGRGENAGRCGIKRV